MTNLEWVLENQEELVVAKLRDCPDRAIEIALGTIALADLLSWNYTVNVEQQKLVIAEGSQDGDKRYIYSVSGVADWLQAERKVSLEPPYMVGTVIKNSHGDWYFYNGVKDNKHLVVDSPHYVGKKCGVMYYDESFKETFTPVRALSVSDRYTEQIYAPVHKD